MARILDDDRITAIRADKIVGRGSCSVVDECYSDKELQEALDNENTMTPDGAIRWARQMNGDYFEQGLNQLSGDSETDDPIRKMAREAREGINAPIVPFGWDSVGGPTE